MDLQVVLFVRGCDRCSWWARELDDVRGRTGWLTLPKALLDHLEESHGVRQLVLGTAQSTQGVNITPGVHHLREVTGR